MATYFYGSTISSCWRAYGAYTTSSTNTTYTISLTGGFQCQNWGFAINYVDCTATVGSSSTATTNNSVSTSTGSYDYVSMATQSATITKTTSSQSVTLSVVTYNHSGYKAGTSTATTTVTVPALTSYTITYNANGGSGAPSSQTKYYGKTLTLSTTVPTRTSYNFLGWSTSSSATSATYSAGGSYTANASATLYAVWELAYIAPTINSFTAYRSNSSGTESDDGTYLYTYVKATADRTTNTSNNIVTVKYSVVGSSTKTYSYSNSSQTATLTKTISASLSESVSYTVTVTVTDSNSLTASKTVTLPIPSYIIDIDADGAGVGILAAAPDSGVRLGTDDVGSYYHPVYLDEGIVTECTYPESGNWFGAVPWVHTDGVIELGRYIDFHPTDTSTLDYNVRFDASTSTTQRILYPPPTHGGYLVVSNSSARTLIQVGTVSVSGGSGSVTSADVTFGTTFAAAPYVFVTAYTTVPGIVEEVSAGNVSTTGCTVYMMRSNSTTTAVRWLAIGY